MPAHLKWKEDDSALSAPSKDESSAIVDPVSLSEPSKTGSASKGSKEAEHPLDKLLEGRSVLARLCESRGENDQAEPIYRELAGKAPNDARIHHRLGVLELQKGNFDQAEGNSERPGRLPRPPRTC